MAKVAETATRARVKELRYSDETHFHVDGKSKSQKFGFWSHGKFDVVAEAPLYSAKITCVMITDQQGHVIEPWVENV